MIVLILGGVVMTFLEFVGVAAILPLLMIVMNPTLTENHPSVKMFYDFFNAEGPEDLAMILGVFIAGLFITKNILQVLYARYAFRTQAKWRIKIISNLYDRFMNADYEVFMQRSSAQMINLLTQTVPTVLTNFIHPMLNLANYMLTSSVILLYIIGINWMASLIIFVTGIVFFKIYNSVFKQTMFRIGDEIQGMSRRQYSLLQQSFAGYKDTHAHLKERFFSWRFMNTAEKLSTVEEKLLYLKSLPPVVVEFTIMLILLAMFEAIIITGGDIRVTAAQLGVIVFALVRMIPIMNRSISAIASINSSTAPLNELFRESAVFEDEGIRDTKHVPRNTASHDDIKPLVFDKELALSNIAYVYPNSSLPTLNGLNLSLKPGEFIGLTGPSGSGKSTLINILLGFLTSYQGNFTIDDKPITKDNIRNLRKIIGYVDQHPFIMEATIAENIAFGIELQDIDRKKVEDSLKKAQLWPYVETLPKGIDTDIGESGKMLSGGQRQRIAIARAFYRDQTILILDEASASLDVETEYKLFNFLKSLKGSLTVIMIAHRLSTLQSCDRIYFIERGKISDFGTFKELYQNNDTFKNYIEYSQIDVA